MEGVGGEDEFRGSCMRSWHYGEWSLQARARREGLQLLIRAVLVERNVVLDCRIESLFSCRMKEQRKLQ